VTNDCQNLDAYLDGELTPGEGARFAAHLTDCPACREAVDEQQWIDGLLRAPAIAQRETSPPALVESFRRAIARRLRYSRLAAGGAVAAAAVLLVAVGWAVKLHLDSDGLSGREVVSLSGAALDVDEPSPAPSLTGRGNDSGATFVGGPDLIVVPVESHHPEVTIVRVYPTFQPDISDQVGVNLPSGEDEVIWPELFNGG
jgi:Putative zinc-finger